MEKIVDILTGHILKDPQIIIDYHQNQLKRIDSTYANQIKNFDIEFSTQKTFLQFYQLKT
jgi:hypothetical protein